MIGGFDEAVIMLYKDRQLSSELGIRGKEYVSEHLTSGKIGARMHEILASMIK